MRMDFNWILGRDNSGAYRQFNTPKAVNGDVASYHQLIMTTVVGIITTLAITSIATGAVTISYRNNPDIAKYNQRELNVLRVVMEGCASASTREVFCGWMKVQGKDSGGSKGITFCAQGKAVENNTIEQLCTEEIAREILLGRGFKPSERMMWAEAYPVAACCFCLLVWLLTYPLLYVNKQWVQRCIYYLLVTSKILAVSSLHVRPLLLYLVWQFMISFGLIFLEAAAATLCFVMGFVLAKLVSLLLIADMSRTCVDDGDNNKML